MISLIHFNKLDHRHYEQNRAPLGLYLHAAWFVREPEMMDALLFWLDEVLRTYGDTVYVVTMSCGTPLVYYLGIEENRQTAQDRARNEPSRSFHNHGGNAPTG